jgi:hypothetical protein
VLELLLVEVGDVELLEEVVVELLLLVVAVGVVDVDCVVVVLLLVGIFSACSPQTELGKIKGWYLKNQILIEYCNYK